MTYRTEDQVRDETNVPIHKLMFQKMKNICKSKKPGWIVWNEAENELTSCFLY